MELLLPCDDDDPELALDDFDDLLELPPALAIPIVTESPDDAAADADDEEDDDFDDFDPSFLLWLFSSSMMIGLLISVTTSDAPPSVVAFGTCF